MGRRALRTGDLVTVRSDGKHGHMVLMLPRPMDENEFLPEVASLFQIGLYLGGAVVSSTWGLGYGKQSSWACVLSSTSGTYGWVLRKYLVRVEDA